MRKEKGNGVRVVARAAPGKAAAAPAGLGRGTAASLTALPSDMTVFLKDVSLLAFLRYRSTCSASVPSTFSGQPPSLRRGPWLERKGEGRGEYSVFGQESRPGRPLRSREAALP